MPKAPEMTKKEAEMRKRFKDFKRALPDKMIIRKGGPHGEDVTLLKKTINGVPVYSAEVDIPFWGTRPSGEVEYSEA